MPDLVTYGNYVNLLELSIPQ